MRLRAALVVACALAAQAGAPAARAQAENPKQALNEARQDGWTTARFVADNLRNAALPKYQGRYPGIAGWIADFDPVAAQIDRNASPARWQALRVDALVSRNPKYWRAMYEVVPTDPAMMTIHGALLLAAGEATRARYVFVLAGQLPRLQPTWRDAFVKLAERTAEAARRSQALVLEGIQSGNRADHPAALEKFAQALLHWPQNPAAHLAIGRTLREQAREAARNPELPDPPEAVAAIARARSHDPLLLDAYLGGGKELHSAYAALVGERGTNWLRLNRDPARAADRDMLPRLAGALQRAGVHELALLTRQVVVAQRGSFHPDDVRFLAISLAVLAPGEPVDAALARLASRRIELFQVVAPADASR